MGVAIFFKEVLLLGLVSLVVSRIFNNHAFACFLVDFLVTTVVLIGFRVMLVLVYDLYLCIVQVKRGCWYTGQMIKVWH